MAKKKKFDSDPRFGDFDWGALNETNTKIAEETSASRTAQLEKKPSKIGQFFGDKIGLNKYFLPALGSQIVRGAKGVANEAISFAHGIGSPFGVANAPKPGEVTKPANTSENVIKKKFPSLATPEQPDMAFQVGKMAGMIPEIAFGAGGSPFAVEEGITKTLAKLAPKTAPKAVQVATKITARGVGAGAGNVMVGVEQAGINNEEYTKKRLETDLGLGAAFGVAGEGVGQVISKFGGIKIGKQPLPITAEKRAAVDAYIANKGTKLRETQKPPGFVDVNGDVLDVKRGEVIKVNDYPFNKPPELPAGVKVNDYQQPKDWPLDKNGNLDLSQLPATNKEVSTLRKPNGQYNGSSSVEKFRTKPGEVGVNEAKDTFINTMENQLQGTAEQGQSKIFNNAKFTNKNVNVDSLNAPVDSQDVVKQWESKISKGERPTILTVTQNGESRVADGAHKLQAYKNLGISEVPTINADMTGVDTSVARTHPRRDSHGDLTDMYGNKTTSVSEAMKDLPKETEQFRIKDDYQKATGLEMTDQQEQKIIELNQKFFGDEDIKITGQILTPQGQEALGSYRDGMIKILDGQADATDTFMHEAVHKYLDVFTTADEQANLIVEAQKRFGSADLATAEESLAEHFINYSKGQDQKSPFKITFDKIITRIKSYFGNEDSITKMYNDILSGNADKTDQGLINSLNTQAAAETGSREIIGETPPALDTGPARQEMRKNFEPDQQKYELASKNRQKFVDALGEGWIGDTQKVLKSRDYSEGRIDPTEVPNFNDIANTVRSITGKDLSKDEVMAVIAELPTKADLRKMKPTDLGAFVPDKMKGSEPIFKKEPDLGDLGTPEKAIPAQKTVKISEPKLPVGEGKQKVSKLASRTLEGVDQMSEEDLKSAGISYNMANNERDAAAAAGYVESHSPEEVMKALQTDDIPQGLLKTWVYRAMIKQTEGTGDVSLLTKLASLEATRGGQETQAWRGFDQDNAVTHIADLQKAKIEAKFGKLDEGAQAKANKAIKSETDTIKTEITKFYPTKDHWAVFAESLRCK